MNLTTQLTKQATRTVANKAIRKTAKNLPLSPMVRHVGTAALIAGISYLITNKIK